MKRSKSIIICASISIAILIAGTSVIGLNQPGNTWYIQTSWDTSGLFDVYFSSDNVGWAVGVGTILHTSDAGNIWYEQEKPIAGNFYSVYFVDDYIGWAAGSGGSILHTTNGGNNWVTQNSGYGGSYLFNLFFFNATHGWAAGGKPTTFSSSGKRVILQTTDGGNNWVTNLYESSTFPLNAVYFTDPDTGWVVGDYDQYSGSILHTVDGGNTWITQDSGITQHLHDVYFTDGNNGWIPSLFGTLLHTTDGGSNWIAEYPGTSHSLSAIHFTDIQHGWICGGNNTHATILGTTDGGVTWNEVNPGTTHYLYGIHLTDASHGWAVGFNGTIISTIPTTNTPPDQPSSPIPSNGETNIYLNPTLSVIVHDPNSEDMTVNFYDASTNTLIGTNNNVASGSRAYIIWNYLSDNQSYNWYAVADDGQNTTQSDIWSFSTGRTANNPNEVNINLHIGWNQLGWYHPYDSTARSLSENITRCLSVSRWDSINQTYHTYIVGGPPVFDFTISRGMGLFVDVNQESVWYGEG
jgi:photosystem II stability/assembly factor-like uncharacterized protein